MSTPVPVTPESEVRPFPTNTLTNIAAINESINRAVGSLPPDRNGAVIFYSNGEAANAAIVANLGAGWSFVGHLDYDFSDKKLTYGAEVRWMW